MRAHGCVSAYTPGTLPARDDRRSCPPDEKLSAGPEKLSGKEGVDGNIHTNWLVREEEAEEERRRTGDSRFSIGICPILSGLLLGPLTDTSWCLVSEFCILKYGTDSSDTPASWGGILGSEF